MATLQELEAARAAATTQAAKDALDAEIQKVKLQEKAQGGDDVANLVVMLKNVLDTVKRNAPASGAVISKTDIDKLLKEALQKSKIRLEDLSDELRAHLTATMKVGLSITTDKFVAAPGGTMNQDLYETPLFQKILSDAVAMNNVYLFGGAGTGKTFIAEELARFLGYEYIELACNQFTSPLEILGGQTIDGYQRGKLERAWGNLDEDGNPSKYLGAVLCLDELPKIDPNTAGTLNGALAKVKDYKSSPQGGSTPPVIENGRGQKIPKGNLVVIATGNLKLNELSTEYEANFKQDLSLQDRFAGSTYEVVVNYENEYNNIMRGFAFIWIAMTKLREKIIKEKWTPFAFVSLRIMINLKMTYIKYREAKDGSLNAAQGVKDALKSPKTIKQGLDSFLNLFKPDQIIQLKQAMDYDGFLRTVAEKDRMPLDKLNTPSEEAEAKQMIKNFLQIQSNKTA